MVAWMFCSFPDVMMPAYESSPWSSIFFIVYISLQIFLFMKLVIVVFFVSVWFFEAFMLL